jgi:hypothetical protein
MTGANWRRSRAGGWRRRPAPVAADSVGPWLANCYRLHVKSGHQCGGSIRGNKERASKVLYCRGPNVVIDDGQVEVPNSQLISCLDSSLGRASACGAGGRRFAPPQDMFVSALS